MLSDAPFTSPWSPEVLISEDFKLPVLQDNDDDDLFHLYQSTYNLDNRSPLESLSSSLTSSSECSIEDLYADGDEESFMFDIDADTCIQGLEANLNDLIDCSTMVSVDWLDSDISSNNSYSSSETWSPMSIPAASQAFTCSTVQSVTKCHQCRVKTSHCSTKQHSTKYHNCTVRSAPCKKWSHMTKSERSKTIDELSLLISTELSLREQMDIVKIINPTATLSKQTTEFVIDLNVIDDLKLEKIQNIVHYHCVQCTDLTDNHSCHSPNRKFSKKSKSQDRRPKVPKQRVQKEYRQKLKEKRSGLFVKEERLAVSETIVEEEIDILG